MKPSSILSSPARDRGVADLPDQRQERILGEVARNGGARVSELTELLGVSDMTVRRDLDTLARRGLVRKVHGGATLPRRGSSDEPGFEAKSGQERPAKDAIARRAAEFVEPGTAVAVTAGTTTHALAHYLARVPELTVVTNSLPVAEVLDASGRPDQTVVLSGGIRTPSDALVGPVAVRAIRSLHVDWAFMGVHGIRPAAGARQPRAAGRPLPDRLPERSQCLSCASAGCATSGWRSRPSATTAPSCRPTRARCAPAAPAATARSRSTTSRWWCSRTVSRRSGPTAGPTAGRCARRPPAARWSSTPLSTRRPWPISTRAGPGCWSTCGPSATWSSAAGRRSPTCTSSRTRARSWA